MTNEIKNELEKVIAKGGFHSKVAQTVLSSGVCSFKQMEILNEVADIFFDLADFPIDVTNLKHDETFAKIQANQVRNQSINI